MKIFVYIIARNTKCTVNFCRNKEMNNRRHKHKNNTRILSKEKSCGKKTIFKYIPKKRKDLHNTGTNSGQNPPERIKVEPPIKNASAFEKKSPMGEMIESFKRPVSERIAEVLYGTMFAQKNRCVK